MTTQRYIDITHRKFEEYLNWACNCPAKPLTDEIPVQLHHRDCHIKIVQTFLDNTLWFNDWSKPDLSATVRALDESNTLRHVKDFLL